ncbi:hypothetical protein [Paraburkholderia sp. J41]|uniref:hypothetical protein n=1 Tax=Paraburkholderia sp. J41 TaxID=2805433 RepID=UPI002AC36CD0|nr:hypothetical protein [Paraburkholderia sp. J41]
MNFGLQWWMPHLAVIVLFLLYRLFIAAVLRQKYRALRDCQTAAQVNDPEGRWHDGQNPCVGKAEQIRIWERRKSPWYWLLIILFVVFALQHAPG